MRNKDAMLRYLLNRVAAILLILWVVTILIFAVTELLPGDVVNAILGRRADGPAALALRQELNLDQPALWRYFDWVRDILSGDLGNSLTLQVPVGSLVAERFRNSLALAVVPLFIGVPLSILLGIVAALQHQRWSDHVISTSVMLGIALPEFVIASFAIILFAHYLDWFPAASLISPNANLLQSLEYLILPSLVLSLGMVAHVTRMTRAQMIEVLRSDYIRTAILKGIPMRTVILHHALRPALVTTCHVVALNIGYLMSGIIVVESVFSYPGLGRLLLQAINSQDTPLLQIIVMLLTTIYVLANLLADLLTFYLDPHVEVSR